MIINLICEGKGVVSFESPSVPQMGEKICVNGILYRVHYGTYYVNTVKGNLESGWELKEVQSVDIIISKN